MEKADRIRGKSDKAAPAAAETLMATAAQLLDDAATAKGMDATRFRSLSSTLKGRAEGLR